MQSREIEKTQMHYVERSRLRQQLIEDFSLVHFAVAEVDKAGIIAVQIEQGVQLVRKYHH